MSTPAVVPLTSSPVSYTVLFEPRASYRIGGGTQETTLTVGVAAADLVPFLTFASGANPTTVDLGGGVTATRHIPASDPDFPALLLSDIEGTSVGGYSPSLSATRRNWSHVKLTLRFASVPYPTDGSTPFMTTELRPTRELVTLAGATYRFADGTSTSAGAGPLVPSVAYVVTIFMATSLGDDVILDDTVRLNNAPVTLGTKVCARGTVMLQSPTISRTMLANGQVAYQRTLPFAWRFVDWNYSLRPNGVWEPTYRPGGTTEAFMPYQYVDFAPLFT